jgi:peptidoglycan/LPS O-acetylase OafA/YrhL
VKAQLDTPTSVFLNAVRFSAALVVFLGHISGNRFSGGLLWPFGRFMDLAVMIFFVLSGFVIAYVTEDHERDLRTYSINRVARIYSVALPALAITLILDSVGRHLRPDLYTLTWGFSDKAIWLQFLTSGTFTQRLWWQELNPGSDLPYWSLGYEVWYYIIFAAFNYLRGAPRYVFGFLACLAAGPVILSLFPIWLLGYATYHISKDRLLPEWLARFILYLTAVVLLGLFYMIMRRAFVIPIASSTRYAAGLIFALNIMAFRRLALSQAWITRLERPIAWFAGMTFSLYLFHLPVAQFLTTIVPWPPTAIFTRLTMFGGTFMIVVLLAELTERRKSMWRSAVSEVFSRIPSSREPKPARERRL